MDVRSNPRLNRYYVELVERILLLETPQGVPAGTVRPQTPSAGGRTETDVSAVINHAKAQFELGRVYLKNNKQEAAKGAFVRATEIAGGAGPWAEKHAGLQAYRISLAERIRQLGAGEEPALPAGFTEQRFEPSPLDELRELVRAVAPVGGALRARRGFARRTPRLPARARGRGRQVSAIRACSPCPR